MQVVSITSEQKKVSIFPIINLNKFFFGPCEILKVKTDDVSLKKSWIFSLLLILIVQVCLFFFITDCQKVREAITWDRL